MHMKLLMHRFDIIGINHMYLKKVAYFSIKLSASMEVPTKFLSRKANLLSTAIEKYSNLEIASLLDL